MTTTTKTQLGFYVLVQYYDPCSCRLIIDPRVAVASRSVINHADTIRRPYPSDPLSSMTQRSHSRTLTSSGLFVMNRWIPGGVCGPTSCAPGASASYWKESAQFLVPSLPAWDNPTVDWAEALRNKIRSRVVSYAESIGEWRESVKMLQQGASMLRRAWQLARALWRNRRKRRAIIAILKKNGRWLFTGDDNRLGFMDLVSADLAIKFGILPLAGLLEETVQQAALNRGKAFRCQVTIAKHVERYTAGLIGGECLQSVDKSTRAIAYVRLKDSASDYTAGSLPEALWAGTRMSFMIDWFFNVSSYLSALDAMRDVASVTGCTITRTRKNARDERSLTGPYDCRKAAKTFIQTYDRNPMSDIPLPRIGDNWEPTPTWGKLQSAIEVLLSLRRAKN